MIRILLIAAVVFLLATFPATWLLMLFPGDVGANINDRGAFPLGIRSWAACLPRPARRSEPRPSRPVRQLARRYRGRVSSPRVPGGVVHELPPDLRKALTGNATALDAWNDITPLARNEFICWVEDAKQDKTRERRIRRTQEELEEGQRRPCCWPGCKHRERTGKA